jgi:phosphohistidine swiveling domain-containing protein
MGDALTTTDQRWELAARGMATSFKQKAEGALWEITGARDALELMDEIGAGRVAAPVVLVHEAGGTTIGPLLEEISGVVSTTGTLGAHVALLAKEYGCPCIVGAEWEMTPADAVRVRLDPDGSIWAVRRGS